MRERHTSQSPPHPPVLLPIGIQNRSRDIVNRPAELNRLAHLLRAALVPDQVAVDVAPGGRIREAEVVGRDAHHRSINVVQALGAEGLRARHGLPRVGQRGGPLEERAGELGEGVEEDVIECFVELVCYYLVPGLS